MKTSKDVSFDEKAKIQEDQTTHSLDGECRNTPLLKLGGCDIVH